MLKKYELHFYDYDARDLVTDQRLVDDMRAYGTQGLVGEFLFPVVEAPNRGLTGFYPFIPNGEFNALHNLERAHGTVAPFLRYKVGSAGYFCKNYAARFPIPLEDELNADKPLNHVKMAGFFCADLVNVAKERRVELKVNSATYVSTMFTTGSAWNAAANNGNPVATLNAMVAEMQRNTGFRPTRFAFGTGAWKSFSQHSKVAEFVGVPVTPERAGEFLRAEVRVAEGYFNDLTAGTGVQPTAFFDDCIVAVVQPPEGASPLFPRWGASVFWAPAPFSRRLVPAFSGADPQTKAGWVEVFSYEDEVVLDKNLASILRGINSAQSGGI